jgi:hypothetical protein
MGAEETHGLGYERVDEDPNVEVLLATMDTTARWESTRRLRAGERQRLGLEHGQRHPEGPHRRRDGAKAG